MFSFWLHQKIINTLKKKIFYDFLHNNPSENQPTTETIGQVRIIEIHIEFLYLFISDIIFKKNRFQWNKKILINLFWSLHKKVYVKENLFRCFMEVT